MLKITEVDSVDINNKPKDDSKKRVDIYYNPPTEVSHWEKYQIYYLVFGSFFFTTLIILISNSYTNSELRKLKSQLGTFNDQENLDDTDVPGKKQHRHEYSSNFIKPDPAQKNENWVQERIVKDDVRKEVELWINSFKYLPNYFAKEGPEVDKHVLISGPPGTGKTYLAQDFCQNESLRYAFVKFDTVIWKGSSIVKQKMALDQARSILETEEKRQKRLGIKEKIKPVVIIIDELDSVGIKGISADHSASRDEVNGLLTMFDDINREKLNIIMIGITNYPEALDSALVRPGRFGRKIEVGYPTDEEMDKLFDFLEKEMKSENGYKFVDNKDKWAAERNEENLIIKWPSDFWLEARRITKDIRAKYAQEQKGKIGAVDYKIPAGRVNAGFALRDLEKFIGTCLAAKSGKNVQEIIPDSHDYEAELEKEMQRRIKDMIMEESRRKQLPIPRPTPPTKDKEEEQEI